MDYAKLHAVAPGLARRIIHYQILAVLFVLAGTGHTALAGELALLVNGKAVHLSQPANGHFNERNWGGGLQYDFDTVKEHWVPFLSASGFLDSYNNPSYYGGGGLMRRYILASSLDNLHLDAGVVAFLMQREGFNHGRLFPGILPALSFGTDRVSINVTYIPKVDPKMVALFFFQLKIGITRF